MTVTWLTIARNYIGTKEIVGPKHSSVILGWLRKLNAWWSDDEQPWCGTFCAAVMQEAGLPYPKEWYRAKSWATYGALLRPHLLAPGAILVFQRAGGGHVGFYIGEDDLCYHVLGGNQGNAVSISRILKHRCIATRWPKDEPVIGKPVRLKVNGTSVTVNEA
jgi:uncharacterized protein (TIGR02594 family)